MFEDALMESDHRIHGKSGYWSLISLLLNLAVLMALILWPLFVPLALPRDVMAPLIVAPSPQASSPATSVAARDQAPPETLNGLRAPNKISRATQVAREAAVPPVLGNGIEGTTEGKPGDLGTIFEGFATGPPTVRSAEPRRSFSISSGVMAGNLIEKVFPVYPAIARAARIEGIVVLQATISVTGEIENLRVVSGAPMLQQAALDAVRSWRYKPYLLNGTPVEVETTINVVFSLGE